MLSGLLPVGKWLAVTLQLTILLPPLDSTRKVALGHFRGTVVIVRRGSSAAVLLAALLFLVPERCEVCVLY